MNRRDIAKILVDRIAEAAVEAQDCYQKSSASIGYFVIDDLLPADLARDIAAAFPAKDAMVAKRSLRTRKAIMARMSECSDLVNEAVYAFHEKEVVEAIADITGVQDLHADPFLYAGGISAMGEGDFLNPHIDNSHDKDRERWRAFNLLYYVTPDWPEKSGGNLEVWPDGLEGPQITIHSKFNRLAVMTTHGSSWHSVSPVTCDMTRLCVSNYYFTPGPMKKTDRYHVTSFRGRPEQPVVDGILRAEAAARDLVRKVKPDGVFKLTHVNDRVD